MKKLLVLSLLALCAGLGLWAQEANVDPFAAIEAEELCADEMKNVIGGQHPDMDGNLRYYSSWCKVELRDSSWRPTKEMIEESKEKLKKAGMAILDLIMVGVATKMPRTGTIYGMGRGLHSLKKSCD